MLSSSGHIELTLGLISKWWTGKDVEGRCIVIWGRLSTLAYAWRDWQKSRHLRSATPCSLLHFDANNGGSMFLRNAGDNIRHYTVWQLTLPQHKFAQSEGVRSHVRDTPLFHYCTAWSDSLHCVTSSILSSSICQPHFYKLSSCIKNRSQNIINKESFILCLLRARDDFAFVCKKITFLFAYCHVQIRLRNLFA